MSLDALLDANFRLPPWRHQAKEFEEHVEEESRALLWSMRTGKTKIVLDTASHLARKGMIDCVFICAPNGVHLNWVLREAPLHMWLDVPYNAIAWISATCSDAAKAGTKEAQKAHAEWWAKLREAIDSPKLLLFSVNSEAATHDLVRKILATLKKRRRIMGVWDESVDFRTAGSKRTLMMRALAKHCKYKRILDGTAATNSILHIFPQYELLGKATLGFNTFSEFKEAYAVEEKQQVYRKGKLRTFTAITKFKNLDDLTCRMAKYTSRVRREDCEDLPELIGRPSKIELTPQQQDALQKMKARILTEIEGQQLSLSVQTAKINKLQQIGSGFILDGSGKAITIPGGNPRLERLSEEVMMSPGKVVIWCQFQEDIDRVCARLRADDHHVVEFHGRVSTKKKEANLKAFQTSPKVKAIVAQYRSLGRGRELNAADTMINYSHTFDAIMKEQSAERATKMGGGAVTIIDIVAPGVDEYILSRVNDKVEDANSVTGQMLKDVLDLIA